MKMTFIRGYLRASTDDQNAERARADLENFAEERNLSVASFYIENASGASLARPELFRLLRDCKPGDVLLVEQVDRLSRLNADDWQKLKSQIADKRIRIVALDLPTSWTMAQGNGDEFTARMFDAINGMLLDMLAAIARKDYEDRRRRQAQGIATAKSAGVYTGRGEDAKRNAVIGKMLTSGDSWTTIMAAMKCSRGTVAKVAKRQKAAMA